MRKRSEISKSSTPKTSAAERTIPLRASALPLDMIDCKTCDEKTEAGKATQRKDGELECDHCGAPLGYSLKPSRVGQVTLGTASKGGTTPTPASEAKRVPEASSEQGVVVARTGPAVSMLPKAFCDQCGAEWHRVNDRPMPNCGHAEGFVDDPQKAKRWDPPAGHPRPPANVGAGSGQPISEVQRRTIPDDSAPTIEVKQEGQVLWVRWGKSMFRVADYSTFVVGEFSLPAELQPGDNPVDVVRAKLLELRQIADQSFEIQAEWYSKKLGLLKT